MLFVCRRRRSEPWSAILVQFHGTPIGLEIPEEGILVPDPAERRGSPEAAGNPQEDHPAELQNPGGALQTLVEEDHPAAEHLVHRTLAAALLLEILLVEIRDLQVAVDHPFQYPLPDRPSPLVILDRLVWRFRFRLARHSGRLLVPRCQGAQKDRTVEDLRRCS